MRLFLLCGNIIFKCIYHKYFLNGNEYVIMSDIEANMQIHTNEIVGLNICKEGFIRIYNYDDDLTLESNHDYDVMFVYEPHFYKYVLSSVQSDRDNFDLIWER